MAPLRSWTPSCVQLRVKVMPYLPHIRYRVRRLTARTLAARAMLKLDAVKTAMTWSFLTSSKVLSISCHFRLLFEFGYPPIVTRHGVRVDAESGLVTPLFSKPYEHTFVAARRDRRIVGDAIGTEAAHQSSEDRARDALLSARRAAFFAFRASSGREPRAPYSKRERVARVARLLALLTCLFMSYLTKIGLGFPSSLAG